jgi:hypothetical protein
MNATKLDPPICIRRKDLDIGTDRDNLIEIQRGNVRCSQLCCRVDARSDGEHSRIFRVVQSDGACPDVHFSYITLRRELQSLRKLGYV